MNVREVTTITTIADLNTDKLCIEHLETFGKYLRNDTVQLKTCYGDKYFIFENGQWVRIYEYLGIDLK